MATPKSCHNCRVRRRRCDRSVPVCFKCASTGQECLGYGKLFKWVDKKAGPGSRTINKELPAGPKVVLSKTQDGGLQHHHNNHTPSQPSSRDTTLDVEIFSGRATYPLLDPLFQDLDSSTRLYLNYC